MLTSNITQISVYLILMFPFVIFASDAPLVLEAKNDKPQVIKTTNSFSKGNISYGLRMLKEYTSGENAPYAFIGLYQDIPGNSIRLFLAQTHSKSGLIAGYEYYKKNKLLTRKILINSIPEGASVVFNAIWNKEGIFKISCITNNVHTVNTDLTSVKQIILVSNSKVEFIPNKGLNSLKLKIDEYWHTLKGS